MIILYWQSSLHQCHAVLCLVNSVVAALFFNCTPFTCIEFLAQCRLRKRHAVLKNSVAALNGCGMKDAISFVVSGVLPRCYLSM